MSPFDVHAIRRRFPILERRFAAGGGPAEAPEGTGLVWLDAAATSQKPEPVLRAMDRFLRTSNANARRSVHRLAGEATDALEGARRRVAGWLGAGEDEIVFVRGTTEAINLVAWSYGRMTLREGDVVLVSEMEHHANIVPWQIIAGERGARVVPVPLADGIAVDLDALERLLAHERVRIVAMTHASNVLGTINDVARITQLARAAGAISVIDGAQAVPHGAVDVRSLGADFYAFSSHKVYGPTGIGALYGRRDLLHSMPPWQGGGDMIRRVSFSGTSFADPPQRFEAGTPDIMGAVGLHAALDFIDSIGQEAIRTHEADITAHALTALAAVPGLRLYGPDRPRSKDRIGVFSFALDGVHPHDAATVLDTLGIAVRAGHHCAQPLMTRLGVPALLRASIAMHTTRDEIDALVAGLDRVRELLG
ncbi:MAG: SufS family cysteine desulfurase [Phycisphaeraceae bacterium]|nr:SufS family cysteine desulfurase [Phycisphaeraceae bacterium]